MKLGLYGGTFDPVHVAHLIIAEIACEQLQLERLIFMPCASPPHKFTAHLIPGEHRFRMLELAIAGNSKLSCSDLEIKQGGTSYTIDTVKKLRDQYAVKQQDFYLIIGADNFSEFHTWKQPDQILEICRLAVAGRPNFEFSDSSAKYLADVTRIAAPLLEISSTVIRERVKAEKSIAYFVPQSVQEYIKLHHLYRV